MKTIRIGNRLVGDGEPCFIVAEVGVNHNGNINLAHRLIDAAADAGADAVKFQNYCTEDFLVDCSLTYEYSSQGEIVRESQYDMFKRYELSQKALAELCEHCAKRNIVFFSTPTSEKGVDDLVRMGVPLLKNGSDYLVHLPLIRAMARSGVPTVISTGMATLAEIDDAVLAFREAAGKDLILLVCTSMYPTPPENVHLRRIHAMAAAFGCPIGFSDHTQGIVAAVGAIAFGACMIEKHFTLDKNLPGPDHLFSADPPEFKIMVESIRTMEKCHGESIIGPKQSEIASRRDFRLSCVAANNMPAGYCLCELDIVFRRPGTGLPPKVVNWLVGRRLTRDIKAGHVFVQEDFI